jgi:hypothetical protein
MKTIALLDQGDIQLFLSFCLFAISIMEMSFLWNAVC